MVDFETTDESTATKSQCEKRAAQLGCILTVSPRLWSIDAPPGRVLAGSALHWVDIFDSPPGAWKASAAYDALIEEMSMGVIDCEKVDCDACEGTAHSPAR